MWLDPSNPQLNKNGELHHLLTLEGLPADLSIGTKERVRALIAQRHAASR